MVLEELNTPVYIGCPNCCKKLMGFKDENGAVKIRCSNCGAVIYSKLRIRARKVDITVDLPKEN